MTATAKPGVIETAFTEYMHAAHGGQTIGEVQFTETRRAFYAGATTFYGLLMGNLSPGNQPTDADLALMDGLHSELRAFAARLEAGDA